MAGRITRGRTNRGQRGLTYLELLVACSILMILAAAAIPLKHWDEKRRKERYLRMHLETMRTAIDRYNQYYLDGLIVQDDVDQQGFPPSLDDLADGIEVGDPESSEAKTVRFLPQGIPEDPFTGRAEWGLRSYQDDWDSTSWGGENVYDVYSLSEFRALDGSYYRDW